MNKDFSLTKLYWQYTNLLYFDLYFNTADTVHNVYLEIFNCLIFSLYNFCKINIYYFSWFLFAGGGLIHLSDCWTGQTVSSLKGHSGNIMTLCASSQANLLCSGSADKSVRLWDLRLPKCIDVVSSSSCVTSVCFNYAADSVLLASGTTKWTILLSYLLGFTLSIVKDVIHFPF